MIVEDYHPRCTMTDRLYPPIHPGEILQQDFLDGFGITQHKLAVSIGVPPRRINEIVHGKRRISADTALRLGRYFATAVLDQPAGPIRP